MHDPQEAGRCCTRKGGGHSNEHIRHIIDYRVAQDECMDDDSQSCEDEDIDHRGGHEVEIEDWHQ